MIYAAAKESGRYALHGVLIECIEDTTFFVATDGRRLSLATCKHSESATDDFVRVVKEAGQKKAPIVPVDPLADAVELCLCNPVEEVRMKCGPSAWLCEVAGVTITSKVIEGQFPTWRDVAANHYLPPANTISREALHASTRAAMVVTNDQSRSVQYQFSRSGLVVTAKSSEFGESRIECELDEHAVDAKTNLDPRFVCQFVQPFGKDDEPAVQVHVCPDNGKTVFRIGDSYTGIVMPLAAD